MQSTPDTSASSFKALLQATEVNALLRLDIGILTEAERDGLRRLAAHFQANADDLFGRQSGADMDDEVEDGEDGDDAQRPAKRRKRGGRSPWKPFLNLEALKMCSTIEGAVQTNSLEHFFTYASDSGSPFTEGETPSFMDSYWFVRGAEHETMLWRHRRNIAYLAIGCFIRKVVRPNSRGRVSRSMKEEMRERASTILGAVQTAQGGAQVAVDDFIDNISEWSRKGKKLARFADVFGAGSLLYFGDQLSNDFVGDKMTTKGQAWAEAQAHLTALGLKELAASSGANEFVRAAVKRIYDPLAKTWSDQSLGG